MSVDKLALGTVQFGLEYGINNSFGKPSRAQSLEMLEYALGQGITTFDTAHAYGNAEEILGEFLERHNADTIKIITKLQPNVISDSDSKEKILEIISTNLKESLARLKREYVDGYLLHTPEYVRNEKIIDALLQLKKSGLVKNIGVSIYEEGDAIYAANLDAVDYIQVPYSIFDQRLEKNGFFTLAKKNGKTVFARSAFLQGLFFMKNDRIPAHLENVKPYLEKLDGILLKYNLSRQQAALLFSLKNPKIDYVVFGVDTKEQLEQNITTAKNPIECEALIAELQGAFASMEKNIIFPSLWKQEEKIY